MSDVHLPAPPAAVMSEIENTLLDQGFTFLRAATTRPLLESYGLTDWSGFADSWNRLGLDRYMADGGRYRRRRYATFSISPEEIRRKKHQPHYQSRDHNLLNGGVERWFRQIEDGIADHPVLQSVLHSFSRMADKLTPHVERPPVWHAEVHQFRIEASPESEGLPTPEGMHRDGVDWVMVLMIGRENVEQGITTIHGADREMLGSFTLVDPMDAALVDDHRVYHGVTAVKLVDVTKPAHRDVLVVTLRHE